MTEYRDRLRALTPGDTVSTAVTDPWTVRLENHRVETVTRVGRILIRTTSAVYSTRTGRCLTPGQPLAYPRRIIGTHQKGTP